MKSDYMKVGMMVASAALFAKRPYFIVECSRPVPGSGESYKLYLSLPGEWSEDEADAMRFPQRVLAESHANRFKGVVVEKSS